MLVYVACMYVCVWVNICLCLFVCMYVYITHLQKQMTRDEYETMLDKMTRLQSQIEDQNALISTLTAQKTAGPLKGRRALSVGGKASASLVPATKAPIKPKAGRRAA
jgi:hypothetical protein